MKKISDRSQKTIGGLLVDIDKIPQNAVWRFRREGDFIEKFGGGIVKLKKYLTDKKIPLRLRDFLPVLCNGMEVLAVANVDISESLKIDEKTKNIALITFNLKNWV